MKKYCDKCKQLVNTKIINKTEEYEVFGEKIQIVSEIRICAECGKELFDEELDEKTLNKVYDQYKIKNNLLSAEEIVQIRNKYGLSQRSLAKLLGWGDKTIFRYENGSLQNKTHNYILEQLKDENNMFKYLQDNKDRIDTKIYNKVINKINNVKTNDFFNFDDQFKYEASIYSGFKSFDLDKICLMIEFFVNKFGKIQITKLLKLLNYSDMLFFRENTVSISGLRYKHYTYGPIPENYELILHYMVSNNLITQSFELDNDYEYHYYNSVRNNDLIDLTNEERNTLEYVYQKFKDFGSKQISDFSHEETGYKETNNLDFISYEYAGELNI